MFPELKTDISVGATAKTGEVEDSINKLQIINIVTKAILLFDFFLSDVGILGQ
jgi:hypothetical protein